MTDKTMQALRARIEHARAKHPEGPSLAALHDELEEAIEAHRAMHFSGGPKHRYLDELLDVATVALRLYEGEG